MQAEVRQQQVEQQAYAAEVAAEWERWRGERQPSEAELDAMWEEHRLRALIETGQIFA
jgi:hypothetical protein